MEHIADNSTTAQRHRLAEYIQQYGSISTPEARKNCNVMMPAARIHELKRDGLNIDKVMVREESENGHIHRFARYFITN